MVVGRPHPAAHCWVQDKNDDRPLHLAARFNQAAMVKLLLDTDARHEWSTDPTTEAANKQKHTPLHLAATHNAPAAAAALLAAGGGSAALSAKSKLGLTPAQCAARRGHAALATALAAADPAAAVAEVAATAAATAGGSAMDVDGGAGEAGAAAPGTLLLAPEDCNGHLTAPMPITRGGPEPPPENVDRCAAGPAFAAGFLACWHPAQPGVAACSAPRPGGHHEHAPPAAPLPPAYSTCWCRKRQRRGATDHALLPCRFNVLVRVRRAP
jgi:ankyrin repeat protein